MTPPVVLDTDSQASAAATEVAAASLIGAASPTGQPVATEYAAAQAAATSTGALASPSGTQAATAIGPTASPTPLLVIVANVGLVPAPTATARPTARVAAAQPKSTTAPVQPVAPTAAPAAVAPPVSADVAAAEQYCVDLINAQRTALGLARLAADPTLMDIANSRVADMVARGYTGHNDPVTGVALGPALMRAAGYAPVGENWYGTRLSPPAIADVAMRWFMTDAPHYQNILNPRYTGVGVGIAFNGHQWLLIQDFGSN